MTVPVLALIVGLVGGSIATLVGMVGAIILAIRWNERPLTPERRRAS